jgi:hypothetical protein
MFPTESEMFQTLPSIGPPPLIAVVKNVLYAVDYAQHEVTKYVKENNSWVTIEDFFSKSTQ